MFVCYFLNFINFILHICDKLIWRNKFHRFGTTIKWNCKISIFFIFYFRDSALRYSVINCQCFKLNLLANFYSEFSFESKQELLDWIPSEEEENVQLICLINLFSNIIKKCKKRKKIRKFGTENIFVTHSKKKKKKKPQIRYVPRRSATGHWIYFFNPRVTARDPVDRRGVTFEISVTVPACVSNDLPSQ